jgi:site-specific recombinase XerD
MREQGIDPMYFTGDALRIYKAALQSAGLTSATIAPWLSVLRGACEQFAKIEFISWENVRDIQSVESPCVERNTTPALSEVETNQLLHSADLSTLQGIRDHAMLFVLF